MTWPIAEVLAVLVAALAFFAWDRYSADVVGLGVLLALVLLGLVPPEAAFAGFGSDAVILILGLLVMTAALLRTGVVEVAGRMLLRWAGTRANPLLFWIMVSTAALSAFISNTAATAFFLPIVLAVAARAKVGASRLLMPLAFASILSSSVTLVSTSTNVVVSELMVRGGLEPMGMFEMAPVGIPIVLVGLVYLILIGRHLIPDRSAPSGEHDFGVNPYLTELLILPESPLVGKSLAESRLGQDLDLTVLRIVRANRDHYMLPRATMRLAAGDVVLVEGTREQVLKVKDVAGIEIKADVELSDPGLQSEETAITEGILMGRSPLIGRSLKALRFRERYGLQVLGINRHGESLVEKLGDVRLAMGDMLLLQGRRENLAALEDGEGVRLLGPLPHVRPNLRRAVAAVAIFAGALAAAALEVLPLPVAAILGAFLAFVTRCVTPEEAYREVDWKVLVLIASMLALGGAMENSGAAAWLAQGIAGVAQGLDPLWLLTGFFFLAVALTQPMSNQAAAIVLMPIAIATALRLSLNPRTFAMMIAVAASCSYITPLEPSCLMVYGPGRYRFLDFLKVGALLTVIVYAVAIWLVPKYWPL